MLKKWSLFVVFLLFMVAMVGCSSNETSNSEEKQAKNSPQENVDEKVVVYSPHGEEIMTELANLFEEETGIKTEFLTMGGGELVDRIRAEKENPQADVIYGNPSSVFNEMKNEDLLASFTPTWADKIDPIFKDTENYWYGTIQTPVVMFYNHDMLSEEEAPKDWADLADEKFKDQMIVRSTTSASSRVLFASLIDQFYQKGTLEDEGWQFMKDFDANIKKHVSDSSLVFQSIARQEGAVSFWTLSGVIDNIENNNMPFTMVDAESGSPIITDGIAVINGAKHESAAQKFVEFAGRPDIQAKLAQDFNRMPTHPDALEESPEWMRTFDYKPMNVNWENLAEHSSEWLLNYEDNIRDSSRVE
ncbi:extracellular solute-binding protein [Niallia sp. Krafla_26]|uniref:extracellular solute-binding protein n=1 Tax=Niallia sp. Krafla_26 TaxID=3064703 RepID=UPI003D179A79